MKERAQKGGENPARHSKQMFGLVEKGTEKQQPRRRGKLDAKGLGNLERIDTTIAGKKKTGKKWI